MLVKNLTPFLVGQKLTSRRPPQPEMTVVVRGVYQLAPDKPLSAIEGMDRGTLTGDVFDDEDRSGECLRASDFADYKLRGEVLALATCHVPGRKPLTECPVRFTVGSWSKTLRVIGPRRIRPLLGASDPEPFTSMPLRWANAWGGPGYAKNPYGRGVGIDLLPTVENPGDESTSEREPAGVGPLHPSSEDRTRKLGVAYGADYRKTRAPFYAEDFDWSYFNSAPVDQRIEGYFRGDETFSFVNVHPEARELSGKLPGLRVRVFLKDRQERFREIVTVLDTVTIDSDHERLELTWRGVGEVSEIDLSDVRFLLVASEALGERPLEASHYRAILEAYEKDPTGVKGKLPEGMIEAGENLRKLHAGQALPPPDPTLDPLSGMLRQHMGSFGKEQQAEVTRSIASARQKLEGRPDSAKLLSQLDEALIKNARDATENAIPSMRMLQVGARAPLRLRRPMRKVMAEAASIDEKLVGRDITPEQRKQLDALKALPYAPHWKALDASYQPPLGPLAMNEPGPGADLSERDLQGVDLSGRDLSNANLEEADLTRANLTGTNLRGARLRGALLCRANLTGADLTGADLSVVNAAYMRAVNAKLDRAKLDQTFLEGAVLEGASLNNVDGQWVVFTGANLREVKAHGAKLPRSDFSEADLTGGDFSEVEGTSSLFARATLTAARFDKASLDGASFNESDLGEASFARSHVNRGFFSKCKAAKADFTRATMRGAHFTNADLSSAQLFAADLKEARFDHAKLDGANMARSNLFGANLRRAQLDNAKLGHANLYGANLLGASGSGVDFLDANLKTATLEEK